MKKFLTIFLTIVFCFFSSLEARKSKRKKAEEINPITEQIIDEEGDLVIAEDKKPAFTKVTEQFGLVISDFDEKSFSEARRKASKNLVDKALIYLKKKGEVEAFRAFTFLPDFVQGELYLFVYSLDGACLAHGNQSHLLWKNMYDYQDSFGNYVIRSIIEQAKSGGGLVTYEWKNATKISYVKMVKGKKKSYVVGCGYYPHSKKETVVSFVDGAATYFEEMVGQGGSVSEVFSKFNYSLGNFVVGNLYLFAMDFDGILMAQGDRPGLIGQNVLENKDEQGKYVNKEIIAALKKTSGGVWVDYISKRAPKKTYARRVVNKKGKNYFIACGYYPAADRDAAIDLVKKGYRYLKMHGVSQAVEEFTSKATNDFRYGDLYLFLYNMEGKVVAHGTNPDIVGKNRLDVTDDDGRYYVQEMIEKAKAGGGWLDYRINRASRFVYVEMIKVGKEKLVIGTGLYPISKPETMQLLVKGGASLLHDATREAAFEEFVKQGGSFVRGDLDLFAFDFNSICYAYEENFNAIWKDFSKVKEGNEKPFVPEFIKAVKEGHALITYKERGREKIAYIEKVINEGTSYVVGSSFFR